MSNNKLNGAPRKQLSEQLDRLDTIIDALDAAPAQAVRDAVAGAVREAVVAVNAELSTNPDVLAPSRPAAAQAAPVARPAAPQPDQSAQVAATSARGGVRMRPGGDADGPGLRGGLGLLGTAGRQEPV